MSQIYAFHAVGFIMMVCARASDTGREPLMRAGAIEVIAKPRAVCSGHPRLFMQHRFCCSLLLYLVSTDRTCMAL
jgi:hypothetical protein